MFKGKYKNIGIIFFIFIASFYLFRIYTKYKYNEFLNLFPVDYQIGQRLMISPEGYSLTENFKKLIKDYHLGNLKIYGKNYQNKKQLYDLIIACQNLSIEYNKDIPMFVATDQEGGWIAHLKNGFTIPPSNYALGKKNNKYYTYLAGKIIATELKTVGINVNFAPVVDVASNDDNWVIGPRSYGKNPEQIVELASEFIRAHIQNNVLPVIKHYPGIGSLRNDPHVTIITNNINYSILIHNDLYPFIELLKSYENGVMIANAAFPNIVQHLENIEKNNYRSSYYLPATISPLIINKYLVKMNNYYGLIFSDEMNVEAIKNIMPIEEAVYQSLRSGVDIVLVNDQPEQIENLVKFLKKKYFTDKEFQQQTMSSLKKIIRYKSILFRNINKLNYVSHSYFSITNFTKNYQNLEIINNERFKKLNDILSIDTVSINQDRKKIIPLWDHENLKQNSIIVISSKDYIFHEFEKYVNFLKLKFIKINDYYTDRMIINDINNIVSQVDSNSIIILTVLSKEYEKLTQTLYKKNKNIIVINLLHEANIKKMNYIDTILSTYSDNEVQVKAAIEFLFQGRLVNDKEIMREYLTF